MPERDYKKEFVALIDQIKETVTRADGKPYRLEDIAKRLDYERTHLSRLISKNGQVSERHLKLLTSEFASDLNLNAGEPAPTYVSKKAPPSDVSRAEYEHLLECINRTESKLDTVIAHLGTMRHNQVVIAAMSDAYSEALLHEVAERRKLEPETFFRSIRNKATSKLRRALGMDSLAVDSFHRS